ncbi:MAG: hypothetical protein ACLF0G_16745 [Candidatus Brocadiia bacterium]
MAEANDQGAEADTLAALLGREGRLAPDRAVAVMKSAAQAVAQAHDQGRVLRDVRPAYIRLGDGGRAELAIPEPPPELPLYYPPEAGRGLRLDERSDLYQLGATFYHALAGAPPFEADGDEERALLHVRRDVPPLAERAPKAPVALCLLVHRLLRRDPRERYQSAGDVLAALERIEGLLRRTRAERRAAVESAGGRRGEAEGGRPRSFAERAYATRKRLIVVTSACCLLLLGAVAVLVFLPGPGAKDSGRASARPDDPAPREYLPGAEDAEPERPAPAPRPKPPAPAKPIFLHAIEAKTHGDVKYEPEPDRTCIGCWYGDEARVSWEAEIRRPGRYEAVVHCGGEEMIDGGQYIVALGDQELKGTVRHTGSWAQFEPQKLDGTFLVEEPGTYTVEVRPHKKVWKALMNLRAVVLRPADAGR